MAKIVAGQISVLGLGGHDLWIYYNDAGQMVQQINGLVTDANGQQQPYATSGTLVARYDTTVIGYNASSPQQTVFVGTDAELAPYWEAAKDCADMITFKAYDYSVLSLNSNSVFSTIGACMNVTAPDVGSAFTWTPGYGNVLLSDKELSTIMEINGISAGGPGKFRPPEEIDYPQLVGGGDAEFVQLVGQHPVDQLI